MAPRSERPAVGELLVPVTGAARRARDVITEACIRWELPILIAPASVVVTELVTNALVHAQTMADLTVVRGRRYLLIRVCDGSATMPAIHRSR